VTTNTKHEFTQGPLHRATAAVYAVLAATACFLVACLPFVAAMLLTRAGVLLAIAGFSIGPAWVAMLYAMRAYAEDDDDEPVRAFWRGYRLSWRQALVFWAPYFSLVLILGFDVFGVPGTPEVVRWLLIALGAIALLWGSTVLLIVAMFSFRLVDVLRLAVYGLLRSPRWLLANTATLLVTGALTVAWSEAAACLLAAPIALLLVLNARTLRERLRSEFTIQEPTGRTTA
jgi:uncharacterized membrane protein YesL